ncbi:hypothetical protein BOTBODRAFT_52633 [Botryobasidium botryosum FD-172 SS1]|uniref:F-box domain-containing protein n=1 Tax=Botryobasidium botryosum (strain FD-172 SS1) TaxID=930990 RepID=A0A067N3H3_BOTB1|nr:hypothetical protein BOTBODRAFT_52633 [Botryobasidium botryosum FD-172 SS1]
MIKLPDELLWMILSYSKYKDLLHLRLVCRRVEEVLSQMVPSTIIITDKPRSSVAQKIKLIQSDLGSDYIQSVRGAMIIFSWIQDLDSITSTLLLLRKTASLKYLCCGCPDINGPYYFFPPVTPAVRPHFLSQLTHLDLFKSHMALENLKGARNLSSVGVRRLHPSHADLRRAQLNSPELSYVENLVRALADKPIRYFRADVEKVTIDLVRLVAQMLPKLVSLVLGFKWTTTISDTVSPEEFDGSLDKLANALSPCQALDRFCTTWFIGRDKTTSTPHHPIALQWSDIAGKPCWMTREPWIVNASSRLAESCPQLSAIGWTVLTSGGGFLGLGCVRDAGTDQWRCSFVPFDLTDGVMAKWLPDPMR